MYSSDKCYNLTLSIHHLNLKLFLRNVCIGIFCREELIVKLQMYSSYIFSSNFSSQLINNENVYLEKKVFMYFEIYADIFKKY